MAYARPVLALPHTIMKGQWLSWAWERLGVPFCWEEGGEYERPWLSFMLPKNSDSGLLTHAERRSEGYETIQSGICLSLYIFATNYAHMFWLPESPVLKFSSFLSLPMPYLSGHFLISGQELWSLGL